MHEAFVSLKHLLIGNVKQVLVSVFSQGDLIIYIPLERHDIVHPIMPTFNRAFILINVLPLLSFHWHYYTFTFV